MINHVNNNTIPIFGVLLRVTDCDRYNSSSARGEVAVVDGNQKEKDKVGHHANQVQDPNSNFDSESYSAGISLGSVLVDV